MLMVVVVVAVNIELVNCYLETEINLTSFE